MAKPPLSSKATHNVYYMSPSEVNQILKTNAEPKLPNSEPGTDRLVRYLSTAEFPVDKPGKNEKCPAHIEPGTIIKYTSLLRGSLFSREQSITARSIEQLRTALKPHAVKKTTVSTPPHICVEVKTKPDNTVEIRAWNPWNSGRTKK